MARSGATGVRGQNAAAIARTQQRLESVRARALDQAAKRAMVSTLRKFEPAAKRAIRQAYGVKLGALSGTLKPVSGTDDRGEFIALRASTRRLPLVEFSARWRGRKSAGATAQVRSGGTRTYASAFIAPLRGKRQVLARRLLAGGKRDPRNQLTTLRGPSPFQMVQGVDQANATRLGQDLRGFLIPELQRQMALARERTR